MRLVQVAAFGATLLALGCSGKQTSSTATGSGGNASTSTTGTSSSGSSSTAAGAGGMYMAPPVPTACGAPATAGGATWQAAQGSHFSALQVVWGGKEAAVAYAESTSPTGWTIKLQRLTQAGELSQGVVMLGTSKPPTSTGNTPTVTVATDGTRYIACWDFAESSADHVDCTVVPVGSGSAVPGISIVGGHPSVAVGEAGWALAYASGAYLEAQKLAPDATPSGPPTQVIQNLDPTLLATPNGFAIIAGGFDLYRTDGAFYMVAPATHVGNSPTQEPVGAAAAGDLVGLGWVAAVGNTFIVVPATNTPTGNGVDVTSGMGGSYSHVAAAAGMNSFAVVWSDTGGSIGYRAVDGTGKLVGTVQHVGMTSWDDNPVAITGVADGFLTVTAAGSGLDDMLVTHLACP